jgi:hypothetical protein
MRRVEVDDVYEEAVRLLDEKIEKPSAEAS